MMQIRNGTWWLIVASVVVALCVPLVSTAAGQDRTRGEAEILAPTPWGAPVLVSPANGAKLYHWRRMTTLAWRPVIGAVRYYVETQYYDGTWHTRDWTFTVGYLNTAWTFEFVGDQKGRWRVVAYDAAGAASPSSPWWGFSYVTATKMPTPVLTSPVNNVVFDNIDVRTNDRWTTVAWKMTPGFGYKLEIMYCLSDRKTCWPYGVPVIINDSLHAYYTFSFVGAQPGKWRVTTLGGPINGLVWTDSAPSAWRWFTYTY